MTEISSQVDLANQQQEMSSIDPKQDLQERLRDQMPITAVMASMHINDGVQLATKPSSARSEQGTLASTPPSQIYNNLVPPQYSQQDRFPTFPGSRSPLDRWVPLDDDEQTEQGEEYRSQPRMRDHSPSSSAKFVAVTQSQSPKPLHADEKSVSPTDEPEKLLYAPPFLLSSRSDTNLAAASYYPAQPNHRLSMPASSSSSSLSGMAQRFPSRQPDGAQSHTIRRVDSETQPTQIPQTASSQLPRQTITPKPKQGFYAADLSSDSPILGPVSGPLPAMADPRQNRNSGNSSPVAFVTSSPPLEVPMFVAPKYSYMQRDPRSRSSSIAAAASASSTTLTEQQPMGIAVEPNQYGQIPVNRSLQEASRTTSMPFTFSQPQEYRPQQIRVFSEPAHTLDPPPSMNQVRSRSPNFGQPWSNNNTNNSSPRLETASPSASPSRTSTMSLNNETWSAESRATSMSSSSDPSSPSSQQRPKSAVIVYPAFQESRGAKTFEEMGIPIVEKRKGRCTIM